MDSGEQGIKLGAFPGYRQDSGGTCSQGRLAGLTHFRIMRGLVKIIISNTQDLGKTVRHPEMKNIIINIKTSVADDK